MITYDNEKDEMIYDPPRTSIMVVDVDCQGLFNLNCVGERVRREFPETFKMYINKCINTPVPGRVSVALERGYKLAFLFTTEVCFGKNKTNEDLVLQRTINGIKSLVNKYPDAEFSSGVLNRHTNTWSDVVKYINNENINWTVHRN